ncbi:variable surface lipoprotein [Mycoplasmopsis agalactiae]|uniref:Variable surface lipoprotein F1 (VpmaF1) n=1 Tax=Mycoplasmopsis agalactiae TaxID=2110 RepID=C5JAC4_MYCAA|nr:variable surface lipoprotein [Mycoplasmopsis agalactiae]CAX65722.1 Variable surface lipoprotein F1 (VpmaF1) [Mycoplasmopsis agalactiae]CAX65742.1 Variable surface lipoprotein F1 (VpmaF1) [Mycoplasmopsis agalactiae]CBH40792.1 Variable surface lipoprotein F1 (VpmaF1) [Mycoplasmopsis agalactiae]CBH41018.1 Variable surface lipoprotein F1 (VpmaF1) [Mycoplasmopsis agalactiae]
MKKSKFLLLGSLSSLAAIPFVAAKCGGTKEEDNKKPAEMPGGGQKDPKTPAEGSQNPGTEGGSNQQGSEINIKALKDKINSIWGLAKEFEDRLQNSFKEGDSYQSVLDKITSKLGVKEKELVKLASDGDKNKKLGVQAQQKIKIKVGAEELELEFGKVSNANTAETNSETTKQTLNKVITKTELGEIAKKDSDTVKAALLAAVKGLKIDELTIDLDPRENKAKVKANAKSTSYEGEVTVTFTVKSNSSEGTTTKQTLNKVITKTELGEIAKKDSDTVKAALLAAVKGLKIDELTIDLDPRENKAKVKANAKSTSYEGEVTVTFTVKSNSSEGTTTKQTLNKVITKTELGEIAKKDSDTVKAALLAAIKGLKIDELTIDLDPRENKAKVKANAKSTSYEGEVTVTFTVKKIV